MVTGNCAVAAYAPAIANGLLPRRATTQTIPCCPVHNTGKIQRTDNQRLQKAKLIFEPPSAHDRSDVMSFITVSGLSFDQRRRLQNRWQRGLAIEWALIVLLVAFSTFQFLSVS